MKKFLQLSLIFTLVAAGTYCVLGAGIGGPGISASPPVTVSSLSGLGTGVATALAINVGTAGSPVVQNGAGGTPSSLTLTSATGLPISTGVSGLGTGVATALAVNTGSAGAPVLFNGAGGTPSSLTLTNATGTVTNLTLVTPVLGTPQSGNLSNCTSTSMVLTTPVLGTPTSGNLTNCTSIPSAQLTGALPAISGAALTNLPASAQSLSTQTELWDDFLTLPDATVGVGALGLISQVNGTAASLGANGTALDTSWGFGIMKASTGTDTTGYAGYKNKSTTITFGGGALTCETRVYFPAVSDGTNRYTFRCGFYGGGTGESNDGAYFRYVDNVNTGKWVLVTRVGGVETATSSTATAVAANTSYRLTVIVNAGATSVDFQVNGVSIGTNTTNIPMSNGSSIGATIEKSAGTTSRTAHFDYVYAKFIPTVAR